MKKLMIHVGLPKTGSTALQDLYFSAADFKDAVFIGKSKAVAEYAEIFTLILGYLESDESAKNKRKWELERALGELPEARIIISEEMFVVDTPKCSWQQKLLRLSELQNSSLLDIESIIVVLREPIAASYSFFVETFNVHKIERSQMLKFICDDNQYEVYNYNYLLDKMNHFFGAEKIRVYKYEDLLEEKVGVGKIVRDMGGRIGQVDERVNEKKILEKGYVSARASLKDLVRGLPFIGFLLRHMPNKIYRFISECMARIKLKEGEVVPFPSEKEIEVLRRRYSADEYGSLVYRDGVDGKFKG